MAVNKCGTYSEFLYLRAVAKFRVMLGVIQILLPDYEWPFLEEIEMTFDNVHAVLLLRELPIEFATTWTQPGEWMVDTMLYTF